MLAATASTTTGVRDPMTPARATVIPWVLLTLASGASGCTAGATPGTEPVTVDPATAVEDGGRLAWAAADSAASADDAPQVQDALPSQPGAGAGGGLWVVDADGVEAGVLIRRGSDDNVADRAIYDVVTVFHPGSGLFYDVAMSEATVLYPGTTFFNGSTCTVPVGLGVGGCTECRSGAGIGVLHLETWYEVVGGASYEQAAADATISSGVASTCVPHGTFNAKVYPIVGLPPGTPTPPTTLAAPLRFDWR